MKRIALAGLFTLIGATLATVKAEEPKVKVVPLNVKESRFHDLTTPKPDKRMGFSSRNKSEIEVEVELIGDVIKSATKMAKAKVSAATDDKGTDMKPEERRSFGGSNFQEINRKFMYFHEDEVPMNKVKVTISMGIPAREAKAIKSVKGSIDFLTGTKFPVATAWPQLKKGYKIETQEVKDAGLTLEVTNVSAKRIEVKATGKLDAIAGFDVVGPDGKSQTSGGGWSGWSKTRNYHKGAKKSFDANSKLVITLLKDKKTVTVPIELSNIPLK